MESTLAEVAGVQQDQAEAHLVLEQVALEAVFDSEWWLYLTIKSSNFELLVVKGMLVDSEEGMAMALV